VTKKGVILSDSEESPPFIIPSLTLRISSELRLRASAQHSASGHLAPQNYGMIEKLPFFIGNFKHFFYV
jgi:hypothetical protein